MTLNPDIRGADDVIAPPNLDDMTGWLVPEATTEEEFIQGEKTKIGSLQDDFPVAFQTRAAKEIAQPLYDEWVSFQKSKGRFEGSCDWTLLDEFVLKKALLWLPQIIGSCVCSNTFRGWVIRLMYQNVFFAGEYLGNNEFGADNYSFWCPFSYGMSRKRGNLRSGDGSFCGVMAETLMKDGVVKCNNSRVQEISADYRCTAENDFPEPQGSAGMKLYRDVGNWKYLDELLPYAENRLIESPSVKSVDQLIDLLEAGKPCFVCSMEAIKKVGEHPDGFAIHARDPGNQWAHNMCFHGTLVASDGRKFIRESNESWGSQHLYNRDPEEVEKSFRAGRLTVQAIGEIDGPKSLIQVA